MAILRGFANCFPITPKPQKPPFKNKWLNRFDEVKHWTLSVYCLTNKRLSGRDLVRIGNDSNEEYVKGVELVDSVSHYFATITVPLDTQIDGYRIHGYRGREVVYEKARKLTLKAGNPQIFSIKTETIREILNTPKKPLRHT